MAEACEAQGAPVEYTVGTIFKSVADWVDRVWCVAENAIGYNMHRNAFHVWCMHTDAHGRPIGDVVPGKQLCAQMGTYAPGRLSELDALHSPGRALDRMLDALREIRVDPLIWNGKAAVPYLEWLAAVNGVRKDDAVSELVV